jgi:TatD DNase family protein
VIDFHCHLDLYPDPHSILREVVRRGCSVLAVTTTPLAIDGTKRLIGSAPHVRVGLGLHPELVATRAREVERFCELVESAEFVGEVGLDGSPPHKASLALQRDVFRTILQRTAFLGGRVMSVHSRGAAREVLEDLGRFGGASTAVLHWFSGSLRELECANQSGCWFSVGPAMLKTEKGRNLANRMPADRVLTETDGPFTRLGNLPLFPWDVEEAEAALARLWAMDKSEARARVRENLGVLMKRLPPELRRSGRSGA